MKLKHKACVWRLRAFALNRLAVLAIFAAQKIKPPVTGGLTKIEREFIV